MPAPATASQTAEPSAPITEWFSTVVTAGKRAAKPAIASVSSGLSVGTCSTAACTPRAGEQLGGFQRPLAA